MQPKNCKVEVPKPILLTTVFNIQIPPKIFNITSGEVD